MDKELFVKSEPLVSIVMTTYNGLHYMEDSIRCITNQTYLNWELIISDDASSDGTQKWLKRNFGDHPKVKLFFQERNIGYVANKNFAHQKAAGAFISQQDQDDLCSPERLKTQIDYLKLHPDARIVGCGYKRISQTGEVISAVGPATEVIIGNPDYREFCFWYPSLLIHREVFQKIGYFEDYFSGVLGDDIYWAMRAVREYPIHCLSSQLYSYRDNPISITNSFNSIRKLVMPRLLEELFQQQDTIHTDWIQQEKFDELEKFENDLLRNRSFMSSQFQIAAAKAIDNSSFKLALNLLGRSFKLNPFNIPIYRTVLYAFRKGLTINR
jgi:glycosyltransferase involved in cell wall biosynthesis